MRILWGSVDNMQSSCRIPEGLLWESKTSPFWTRKELSRLIQGRSWQLELLFHSRSKAWLRGLSDLWLSGSSGVCCLPPLAGGPRPEHRRHPEPAARQTSSLHSWHPCGMAINYAQRVHFQFKCVLIPEELLMASSYWCEKSLPLQWLWINEVAVVEAGMAINCQPLVTWILNYVLCPLCPSPKSLCFTVVG